MGFVTGLSKKRWEHKDGKIRGMIESAQSQKALRPEKLGSLVLFGQWKREYKQRVYKAKKKWKDAVKKEEK